MHDLFEQEPGYKPPCSLLGSLQLLESISLYGHQHPSRRHHYANIVILNISTTIIIFNIYKYPRNSIVTIDRYVVHTFLLLHSDNQEPSSCTGGTTFS